jgi:muramidase (phage lysozyme)
MSAAANITSPTGRLLRHQTRATTTPKENAEAKVIQVEQDRTTRLAESKAYLADPNVTAYLKAIAAAEGGGYDFKYGAVKGRKIDPWRFTDTSTHPGAGFGGKITAAGMYQITVDTWRQFGGRRGLTDFTPDTQDLIAVDMLRSIGVIDKISPATSLEPCLGRQRSGRRFPKGPAWRITIRRNRMSSIQFFWRATKLAEECANEGGNPCDSRAVVLHWGQDGVRGRCADHERQARTGWHRRR